MSDGATAASANHLPHLASAIHVHVYNPVNTDRQSTHFLDHSLGGAQADNSRRGARARSFSHGRQAGRQVLGREADGSSSEGRERRGVSETL